MKIVHIVHSLGIGGLENGLVNILSRQEVNDFQHVVCCLTAAGKMAERIDDQRIQIMELGLSANGFRFPIMLLTQLLRRLKPDVVHTRGWPTVDAIFASFLAKVPHIIHGEHGREYSDVAGHSWKRNQIRNIIGRIVDRYVIVCNFFRPWLNQSCRVKNDRIVLIPNGVDTDKFRPPPVYARRADGNGDEAKLALRRKLGLPADSMLVGTVGRLDPVKDFPTLLRGFKETVLRFPTALLVVVGDGPLRAELVRIVENLGLARSILWLGERKDIADLLRCFDLFVQTSIFEGMSNTILEAMSTGLPVVATNTGGNPEVVSPDNGILVDVADSHAVAEAMLTYLTNDDVRNSHGTQSRRRATDYFGLSLMASRYAQLYVDVLNDSTAHA